MNLQAIIEPYHKCKLYELSKDVSSYLHYIDDKPFYISPSFTDIHTSCKESTLHPKFLIFSAPGATGKSSLAKYISSTYGAIYWDLSKFRIGTNSFSGCLLKAIGPQKYSDFVSDLETGEVLLTLDAADEAEMLSGRTMLADFIMDISSNISSSVVPSVMIFARTDTAQFLASLCENNSIPFYRYEIGLFEEHQSKEFICKRIKAGTQPDRDCVNLFYDEIHKIIPDSDFKAFIGYAPVLEVISEYIKENKNRAKLLSSLHRGMDCTDLILSVMRTILARERDEKVVAGFRRRIAIKYPEFQEFSALYSDEEQLVLILNYILFGEVDCDAFGVDLPPEIKTEYDSVIKHMLPQHPFIRNTEKDGIDFAGPAFKDFSLASLLLSENNHMCATLYLDDCASYYMPSQIFLDCYLKISDNIVYSSHMTHLYNSFRARTTGSEQSCVGCCEIDFAEKLGSVTFSNLLADGEHRAYKDNLKLIFNSNNLHFDQLANSVILTPSLAVTLGSANSVLQIYNSYLVCRELIWSAPYVSIESRNSPCFIMSLQNAKGVVNSFKIESADNLKISFPNLSEYYRLYPYHFSIDSVSPIEIDIHTFAYSLCAILREFRTHRKDTLAKDAERIDNVVVGKNVSRRKILEFLIARNIMYRDGHLYKINMEVLKIYGISYTSIINMWIEYFNNIYCDFETYVAQFSSEKTSLFNA